MPSEHAVSNDPEKQLQLACAELRERLRAGEDCRAETLLNDYPALASQPDYALELILTEFVTRQELGQRPDPAAWYARFPQWRDQLRELFGAWQWSGSHSIAAGSFSVLIQQLLRAGKASADSRSHDPATVAETSPPIGSTHPGRGPGTTFAHYELLEELGHGGMGVVYKARDTVLGRLVALKMIRAGVLAGSEEVQRFYREAKAAAQLHHPHLVPLYEIGQHQDQHYFTMGFAPGGSLAQQRERFTADPRAAAALVEKVARAVHHAHQKGILHRDLKPANVLLDEHGEPLVADFGLAKFVDADVELTQTGAVIGTPAYMAPEQAAGKPEAITARSDVWSLGVLLYELLTGKRPFAGKALKEVSQQILSSDPPSLRSLQPRLDRALETVVLKCLEKDPARRYGSAEDLADDLGRWRRGEPIVARPESLLRRARRAFLRSARWKAAAALFFCAAVFLAVMVGLRAPDPGPSPQERERQQQQERLEAIQRDLAAGKPVTLIGPTGLPKWYRWRTEKDRPPLPPWLEEPLSLESNSTGLLELVPDPQCQYYLLSAEVQITQTNLGYAGIFFLGDEVSTPQGPCQRVCALTFADRGTKAGHRMMHFAFYQELSPNRRGTAEYLDIQDTATDIPAGQWHTLAVEVTPRQVIALWDGQPVYALPRTKQDLLVKMKWREMQLRKQPAPAPPFAPRGSLGLVVYRAMAFYRNVVVQPLANH
jgi:hypothetical protein